MEHTSNYNLSQWAGADRILREDFNADNAKIEAAILGANEAAAAAAASGLKVKTGSFSGTGKTGSRTYSIGVQPKLIFARIDPVYLGAVSSKGFLLNDTVYIHFDTSGGADLSAPDSGNYLTTTGFILTHNNAATGLNASGSTLYYWALY